MLTVRGQTSIPQSRVKQKFKTWKFAANFLYKNYTVGDKRVLGQWVKSELLDLGPTFVKLGQIVSTRGDLYPPEFVKELESLQDDVPPVEIDTAHIPLHLFREFCFTPFKSASIGQVHRATLMDGREVVVKIKRPGIYDTMKNDTDNVKDIVTFLERVGVDTGTGSGYVLDESIENLLRESDYQLEVSNAKRFRKNFKKTKWVKAPKVLEDYCTDNIIVMEYVPSIKLDNAPVNKKKICEALITSYVKQTMTDGFFHADPHPGNLGMSLDGKQLVVYDFGLCIEIDETLRQGFMELLVHIVSKDTKKIVETLVRLEIIIPQSDIEDLEVFFETILNYLGNMDVRNLTDEIVSDPLMLDLAQQKPFIIPSAFVYLAKTFSLVEGQCLRLDKGFNYYDYLTPIVQSHVSSSIDVSKLLRNTAEMPLLVKNMSTAILGLEKSRAGMKRSLKKTRREVRYAQYSILCALTAFELHDQERIALAVAFAMSSLFWAFTSRRNQ